MDVSFGTRRSFKVILERWKMNIKTKIYSVCALSVTLVLIVFYTYSKPKNEDECLLSHIDKAKTQYSARMILAACNNLFLHQITPENKAKKPGLFDDLIPKK